MCLSAAEKWTESNEFKHMSDQSSHQIVFDDENRLFQLAVERQGEQKLFANLRK